MEASTIEAMSRLLLLSTTTGYQAEMFRAAAARAGAQLTLATDRCHVLEDPWRDGAIAAKFHDSARSAEAIAVAARQQPISGVVAIGDAPVETAAFAAQALGLPFHPPDAVRAAHNKFLARECFRAAGLRVPWYQRFAADSDPAVAVSAVPFPCVLKPLGLSASRGVIRADDPLQFAASFHRIRELLNTPEIRALRDESAAWIQVETFIPGVEIAVEGILTHGELQVLAMFDKPDPLDGPFFEETIYVTPSRLADDVQQSALAALRSAIAALGLSHGPIHAELRLNAEGPYLLEVAARPIGGLCAGALRFGDDMPLEELIVRHALGEDVRQLTRESRAAGVMMIPIPRGGVYEGVTGVEGALAVGGIERVEITAKLQQKLVPLPEGASYLGFIFAGAEKPQEVEEALRAAHARLKFEIAAEIAVL